MTTTERTLPMLDRPVDFSGTAEEARENRRSHLWRAYDDEVVCTRCDTAIWHVAADYRCGDDPPRELIEIGED